VRRVVCLLSEIGDWCGSTTTWPARTTAACAAREADCLPLAPPPHSGLRRMDLEVVSPGSGESVLGFAITRCAAA
jgi:hypothetical protein